MRILVAEDDSQTAGFIKEGLRQQNFVVDLAKNGKQALAFMDHHAYDVVVLDVVMPGLNGLEVLKEIRKSGYPVAVLLLTSRGEETDKLHAFDAGADDYLVKPFLLTELIARIRAVQKRVHKQAEPNTLVVGDITLNLLVRTVHRNGKRIPVTKKEFELLEYLMRRPGRLLTHTAILQMVWQMDFERDSNLVEALIGRLRKKLNKGCSRDPIQTLRGQGYIFQL